MTPIMVTSEKGKEFVEKQNVISPPSSLHLEYGHTWIFINANSIYVSSISYLIYSVMLHNWKYNTFGIQKYTVVSLYYPKL
jgi:hypothetical protein